MGRRGERCLTALLVLAQATAMSSLNVRQQVGTAFCSPAQGGRLQGLCASRVVPVSSGGGARDGAIGMKGPSIIGSLFLREHTSTVRLSLDALASRNAVDEKQGMGMDIQDLPQKRKRSLGAKLINPQAERNGRATAPASKTVRRRGFGSSIDVEASKPVAEGSIDKSEEIKKPRRKRGFGSNTAEVVAEKDEMVGEAFRFTDSHSDESDFYGGEQEESSEELDQGSSITDAIRVLNPGGEGKPAGSRLRSRAAPSAYILPNSSSRKLERIRRGEVQGGAEQTTAMQSLMRKSMATRGESQKNAQFAHINPGSVSERTKRRRVEDMGVVSLAELSRRDLISPNLPTTQAALACDSNILKELRVEMAVFVLDIVGDQLLSAGSDDKMTLWNPKTWEPQGHLSGHSDWVNSVAVDEKKGIFCSASDDKTVRVWDLKTKECIQVLKGHKDSAHSLAIGETQIFVGCKSAIYVWDLSTWENTHRLTNHTQVLRAMTEGKQMSKNIDTTDTVVLARLPSSLFGHRIGGVVIHKPYMLTSVDDGSIWVWNMATMEVERKLLANTAPNVWVRPLLLTEMYDKKSKTKRLKLVSGWADGAIRVFDMRTWELEETLVAHNGPVLCLDASDGRLLSTGSDMSVYEWSTDDWKIKRVLRGHRGAVCAVTGNDGQTITASLDGFIKVWEKLQ